MISICLKSRNKSTIDLLETKFDSCSLSEIYYLPKKVSGLYALFIHYKGNDSELFIHTLSSILADYIIENYESKLISNQIKFDYFYFSNVERDDILKLSQDYLNRKIHVEEKVFALKKSIEEYFLDDKICNIDGFVSFRLLPYKHILNTAIDTVINEYVIQKEYYEYISLLSQYISLESPQTDVVHLIYNKNSKVLLDKYHNTITNVSNPQIYLSDITFSSNDFLLNSLLTLLPKRIMLHTDSVDDSFIIFLSSIFQDKITICDKCKICLPYITGNNLEGLKST